MDAPTADEAQIAQYRQFVGGPEATQHYGAHQPAHQPAPSKAEPRCKFCFVIWPCQIVEAYSDGLRAAARDLLVHLDRAQR